MVSLDMPLCGVCCLPGSTVEETAAWSEVGVADSLDGGVQ